MKFSDKFIRGHLEFAKPITRNASLSTSRAFQERIGRILQHITRKDSVIKDYEFDGIKAALAIPRDEVRTGVILYLHGGGFVSGGIEYAKGFASVLSSECGIRVATFEYKLAPENVFPSQINESLFIYKKLLENGYAPETIILAGESAGGNLVFELAMKIRDEGLPMPAGLIAISPWCDLTHTAKSHEEKKNIDPSLSTKLLDFYADCYMGAISGESLSLKKDFKKNPKYLEMRSDPRVSPVFADLSSLPPTLIFAGGDEILLSDAENMHAQLTEAGVESKLVVRPEMWHAYHLYRLKSSDADFALINDFIKHVFPKKSMRKLRWMRLDNAAKIYPAARNENWTNVFRLSATLKENIDREVLQSALDVTVRRFPSIAVRIRRGIFWYYLEEIAHAPEVCEEKPYPLVRMPFDDIRKCAFRVIAYKKRIAVEFFHALTDGNGGLVFLKTLVAEYISQKYGIDIPAEHGVLDRLEAPKENELCDDFPKHAGKVIKSRRDTNSYRIFGEYEPDGFCHNTAFSIKASSLVEKAHEYGVTVTAFLAAALIKAGVNLQNEEIHKLKHRKPVKVLVPCDLRRVYGSETLRNFALYATPGIDPRLGEYTVREIAKIVYRQMCLEITPKNMSAVIKTNVKDEENLILKLTPLFLKNIVMKAVFTMCGEKKSMLTVSNLGVIKLPEVMKEYIERFDFVLSVQSKAPYNVGVITYGETAYLNIIRNIKEPRLESSLYAVLREEGISVKVESNQR